MATDIAQSQLPPSGDLQVQNEKPALNGVATPLSGPTESDLKLPLSSKDNVVHKPFPHPLGTSNPVPRPPLTPEENQKYANLLQKVSAWKEVPTNLKDSAPKESLTDDDRIFLTRECLLRYLRATKWQVETAETRLRNTLAWQREYGIVKHTPDYISPEAETGKQVVQGFDIEGRPCCYLFPSRQNTERSPRQINHLVFMLNRLIDLMPPGQDTLALLINFSETRNGQGATVAQAREVMYILQNHYPERLGRALVTNLPWYIKTFFTLISPFIDPVTRQKIKFNEDMKKWVPATQLLKECDGEVVMKYDHQQYWPALNALAEIRRTAYKQRWVAGGKRIGEHEDYLRGGEGAKSLADTETPDQEADLEEAPAKFETPPESIAEQPDETAVDAKTET